MADVVGGGTENVSLYDENGNEVGSGLLILKNRFSASAGSPVVVTVMDRTVIHAPAPGKRIRLKWIGLSTPSNNGAPTEVSVWLGGTRIYLWAMGAPGAFAHGVVREGAVDDELAITQTAAQRVLVNIDIEEF